MRRYYADCAFHSILDAHETFVSISECWKLRSVDNCKINIKGSMDKLLRIVAGRSFSPKQLMISRDSS
jgi:hypothetical protein